jgi:hypothetical protein
MLFIIIVKAIIMYLFRLLILKEMSYTDFMANNYLITDRCITIIKYVLKSDDFYLLLATIRATPVTLK